MSELSFLQPFIFQPSSNIMSYKYIDRFRTFFKKLIVIEEEELSILAQEVQEQASFKQSQTPQKLVIPRFLVLKIL